MKTVSLQPSFLALALAAGLAGCDSIGDGNTIQSLELLPTSADSTRPLPMYECLRDQLLAVATFTDGTRADFSERVRWASSNPAVATVSNADEPFLLVSGTQFTTVPGLTYRAGTLTPVAPGASTITASFASLTASLEIAVGTVAFRLAPLAEGIDPLAAPTTRFVGAGLELPFRLYFQKPSGQIAFPSSLNPVLYTLTGGVPSSGGESSVLPDATAPKAGVQTLSDLGFFRGIVADTAPTYEIRAALPVCRDNAAFQPTATAKVDGVASIALDYEPNFAGPGAPNYGNQFAGTSQLLRATATLTGGQTLDVSTQIDYELTHQSCTSGSTNCICDSAGANCAKAVVFNDVNHVYSIVADDGEDVTIRGCFTDLDDVPADDCEEIALADPVPNVSRVTNVLPIHFVPADATTGTVSITPATGSQPIFTYPGFQFEAYTTLTATSGFTFVNATPETTDDPTTGTQRITRNVVWTVRPSGSTTEMSNVAWVRSSHDGFLAGPGRVDWLGPDITADTLVDIYATPVFPYESVPATTTPVPFTITP